MPRRFNLRLSAVCIALVAVISFVPSAWAVVVLRKGSTRPVMGHLLRMDGSSVVVRETLPSGKTRELTFRRDDISELILTVSPERLAELDPARPQLYREYAEELAEKHRDPEAREAAIRLYHITAWLDRGALRKSAMLGLIALARSPEEERRFRAAAFLLEGDRSLLASEAAVDLPGSTAAREPFRELLSALRLLRQGKPADARAIFGRTSSDEALDALTRVVTREELMAACSAKQLTNDQLHKVLSAELALQRAVNEQDSPDRASDAAEELQQNEISWSQAYRTHGLSPLPSIDLEHLTEFDPQACLFRNGAWVRP